MSRSLATSILPQEFFARSTLTVARELLGKYLVRRMRGRERAEQINEVEAYIGPHDLACHGRFGCTSRTEVMFGPAGVWYVYLCYGIHWMLNIVTEKEDWPAAILLRGAGELTGPGKLTKGLHIDRRLNGKRAEEASRLWIEDRGIVVRRSQIVRSPRVGIDYSGHWKDKPYRFMLRRSS